MLDFRDSDLSNGGNDEFLNADGRRDDEDVNSIKYRFRDETWGKANFTYNPKPNEFIGSSKPTKEYRRIPTYTHFFSFFGHGLY